MVARSRFMRETRLRTSPSMAILSDSWSMVILTAGLLLEARAASCCGLLGGFVRGQSGRLQP